MTKSPRKNEPDVGIELGAACLPSEHASDRATAPGSQRKVYLYQKGDYESMTKDTLEFAKEQYFNSYSDTRSIQETFDLLTSFIEDSADKHIPSKTSRSVSSIPWITPEIRRKIRRKNKIHAKAKKRVGNLDKKFKSN